MPGGVRAGEPRCSGHCGSCGRIGRRWRTCLRSWRRERSEASRLAARGLRWRGDGAACESRGTGRCAAGCQACGGPPWAWVPECDAWHEKDFDDCAEGVGELFWFADCLDLFDDFSGRYAVCVLLGGGVFCPGNRGYPAAVSVDAADADFSGGGVDDAAVERGAAVGDDRDADDAAAGALAGGAGQVPGGDGAGGGGAAADAADPGGGGDAGAAGLGPGARRLPGGAAAGGGVCGAGTVAVGADGQPDRGAAGDGGDRRAAVPPGHAGRHRPDGGAVERCTARGGNGQPV